MQTYTCPTCHRKSYSATDPAHAYSDKCPYPDCTGHVVPVEPKRESPYRKVIQMVRKDDTK